MANDMVLDMWHQTYHIPQSHVAWWSILMPNMGWAIPPNGPISAIGTFSQMGMFSTWCDFLEGAIRIFYHNRTDVSKCLHGMCGLEWSSHTVHTMNPSLYTLHIIMYLVFNTNWQALHHSLSYTMYTSHILSFISGLNMCEPCYGLLSLMPTYCSI